MSDWGLRKLSWNLKSDLCQPLPEISAVFNSTGLEKCSTRNVHRNLHKHGYKPQSVRKRVNIMDINKRKRIFFCRSKLTWKVHLQWKKVIFNNEIMVHLTPDGHLKMWRKASEKWSLIVCVTQVWICWHLLMAIWSLRNTFKHLIIIFGQLLWIISPTITGSFRKTVPLPINHVKLQHGRKQQYPGIILASSVPRFKPNWESLATLKKTR